MNTTEKYLVGVFDDEDVLMKSVKKIRNSGVKIQEVYTPFPIHGLDIELGHPRTRIPIAAFFFALTGTTLALTMLTWMLGFDWPMWIGGKDHIAIPDFIPITFELTVLIGALGMVTTFLISNDIWPGKKPKVFDLRATDDRFVMAINLAKNKLTQQEIESILKNYGATEVNTKIFE